MTTADRMAVLDNGVVQQVGTPAELYDFPVNGFVAGFVGTMNMLTGSVAARQSDAVTLQVAGIGDLDLPGDGAWAVGSRAAASFRPHTVRLRAEEQAGRESPSVAPPPSDAATAAGCIWLRGTVQSREFSGEFTRYHVRVGDHSVIADQVHHAGSVLYAVGSAVYVGIERGHVRLLDA